MSEQPPDKKTPLQSLLQALFRRPIPLGSEITLFMLISAGDFIMTRRLLIESNFVESNPIAQFFAAHWGLKGLMSFKIVIVAFVIFLAQIIATKKPVAAARLLNFASALAACVVIYSLTLLLRTRGLL